MKYREGDLITIKLSNDAASLLSKKENVYLEQENIIKHEPAPPNTILR